MKKIKLDKIRLDGGTQPRAELSEEIITEYSDAMSDGAKFPPVTIFYDGSDYWLADGFHRVRAAERIGYIDIEADIKQGRKRDAILFSVGANYSHGQPRSREDKRRAVEVMLTNPEVMEDPRTGKPWSDNKIAEWCHVSPHTVADVRSSSGLTMQTHSDNTRTYTTKHGTVSTMNISNIGHRAIKQNADLTEPVQATRVVNDFEDVTPEEQSEINEEVVKGRSVRKEEREASREALERLAREKICTPEANRAFKDFLNILLECKRNKFQGPTSFEWCQSCIEELRFTIEN